MTTQRMATWLGYAGLLPFLVFAALALWAGSGNAGYQTALIAYGATILAFLGGVHWGQTLQHGRSDAAPPSRLIIAVIPQLIAWVALLLAPTAGILLLAAALVMMLALDLDAIKRGIFPLWYRRLRWILTTVATAALVLTVV